MSDNTKIEWTDATWNPIRARSRGTGRVGWWCSRISTGCKHCYAERMNRRLGNRVSYAADKINDVELFLDEKTLEEPLRWRRPRRVFVCSMTDLFHEAVPDHFITDVFSVMAEEPKHTFQVLTKRPERMLRWPLHGLNIFQEPLPNVWLGVSIETAEYLWRSDTLKNAPAAVRFLSLEPLLGPLRLDLSGIHWVIAGGESGPNARPAHPDWFRSVRDQCVAEGVPFFFKQWGEWEPADNYRQGVSAREMCGIHRDGRLIVSNEDGELLRRVLQERTCLMRMVGKRAAGRLLDGREWNEFPISQSAGGA